MKKKMVLLATTIIATVTMGACVPQVQYVKYNGERLPVDEVEERIADELEVENPDLDLEVDILEEIED